MGRETELRHLLSQAQTVEEINQTAAELQRHEREERSSGHITEQGGGSKGDGDQPKGRRIGHLGDRGTCLLEGRETVEVVVIQGMIREK